MVWKLKAAEPLDDSSTGISATTKTDLMMFFSPIYKFSYQKNLYSRHTRENFFTPPKKNCDSLDQDW